MSWEQLSHIQRFELEQCLSGGWGAEAQVEAEQWCLQNGVDLEYTPERVMEKGLEAQDEKEREDRALDRAIQIQRLEKKTGRTLSAAEWEELEEDAEEGHVSNLLDEYGYNVDKGIPVGMTVKGERPTHKEWVDWAAADLTRNQEALERGEQIPDPTPPPEAGSEQAFAEAMEEFEKNRPNELPKAEDYAGQFGVTFKDNKGETDE